MRTVTVQDFHDHVAKWLHGKEPVVVTRYGKEPLGIYYPAGYKDAPKEIRWAIFEAITKDIGDHLRRKGVSEEDLVRDFDDWRKNHGKAGR
jgi:hypothetical protein